MPVAPAAPAKPAEKLTYIRHMALAEAVRPMYLVTRRSSEHPKRMQARLYSAMASASQAMRLWMLKDADAMHMEISANDLPNRKVIVLVNDTRSYTYEIKAIYPDSNIETEI